LYNQYDLIAMRHERGVDELKPGITGWAQVNGRDSIPLVVKVNLDEYYLKNRSLRLDLRTIWMTFFKTAAGEGLYAGGKMPERKDIQ